MKKIILLVVAVFFNTLLITPATNAEPNQPNENAKGYWDQDKINNAIPIELVMDPKTNKGKLEKLARSGGTSTKTTSNSGASWNGGGLALAATGKVFFSSLDAKGIRNNYVCSGSLVNEASETRAIVLTAGHCAYDFVSKSFVDDWMFIPNFDTYPNQDCSTNVIGCWYASNLVIRNEFASAGSFNTQAVQHDWAFAVITLGGRNIKSTLPDIISGANNSFPLLSTGFNSINQISYAFGYPAAFPYAGSDLVYANGPIFNDTNNQTWGMSSNLTGGASGGPWLSGFSTTSKTGSLSSLNSYKYSNDKSKMYGPKFNSKTDATLNQAKTATGFGNYLVN